MFWEAKLHTPTFRLNLLKQGLKLPNEGDNIFMIWWVLWTLELASEFFYDFFAYYFGQRVKNLQRNTVAVGQEFDIPEVVTRM